MNHQIPLFKMYSDESDVDSISEVIRSKMNWTIGPKTRQFEQMIKEYLGIKYAAAFNSGTSALHALLMAHDIRKNNEVIVPSFSFIATSNAVIMVGAKPVFSDIETETYGLNPDLIKKKMTKRTKAIIPVHYGGGPCQIEEIREFAENNDLLLIEDAAESLGASANKKKVGSFGTSSIISFTPPKLISTGEGGMGVTHSKEIYEKIKLLRNHGRAETADYFNSIEYMDYITLGYNFRMSEITAALGVSQFNKLDKIIEKRRKNAEHLIAGLSDNKEISLPIPPKENFHVYQMFTIRLKNKKIRDSMQSYLMSKGIMSRVYFYPIHKTGYYNKLYGNWIKLPITEKTAGQVLTLPMYPDLTTEELDYIIDEIKHFFRGT